MRTEGPSIAAHGRRSAWRWLAGLALATAAAWVPLGCPNSRLEPVSFDVSRLNAAAIAAGDGHPNGAGNAHANAANAGTNGAHANVPPPPLDAGFTENFADPLNTVSAFLLAVRMQDEARLRRTLSDNSQVPAKWPLAAFSAEPWRWSDLQCTIWKYTGVGPLKNLPAPNHVRVVVEPPANQAYHVWFHLIKRDGRWLIWNFEPSYESTDLAHAGASMDRVVRDYPLTELPEETAAASAAAAAKLPAVQETAAALNAAFSAASMTDWVMTEAKWRATLPPTMQATFTAEDYRARMQALSAGARQARTDAGNAEFVGGYIEREFVLAGADSASVYREMRLCYREKTAVQRPFSILAKLVGTAGRWHLAELTIDTGWPDGSAARLGTDAGD